MPQAPHIERHFRASQTVRDIVIGIADGLTVPFALAAGFLSFPRSAWERDLCSALKALAHNIAQVDTAER